MKIPTREEVRDSDKWHISDIYSSDEQWQEDFDTLERKIAQPCAYKGHAGQSQQNLYQLIQEYDWGDQKLEKLYVYAFMKFYEDTANPQYQKLSGKAQDLSVSFAMKYAFMEPEIIAIPEAQLRQWCMEDLKPYAHFLEDILLEKAHTLTPEAEEMLANVMQISNAPKDIFAQFNNADIKFGMVKDDKGEEIELTNGRFSSLMQSSSRKVRESAFHLLYKAYREHINTLASVYNAEVKQAVFFAGSRHYQSTLDMYLTQNNIDTRVYTNLIQCVNEHLDLMHRYVGVRKQALGVEELHFYDVYAPMVSDFEMKVDYEEAKEIVKKGLAPLGAAYTDMLQQGFDNGWVDVYENTGKRSGAFSWGEYETHPFVFLNYDGKLDDVFTLAHEMGHAMHTYYSNTAQPHIYAGYRIFVAEVASTCNEALLIRYLLEQTTDLKERQYLLNHFLEQFKGTLFRQTMFAEFELTAHRAAEAGEILNAQKLCDIYRELNRKYFGSEMVLDEEIAYEWSRIPHFYTPFYVYQYATGFSAAIAISSRILAGAANGDDTARKGYQKFLSGGSSLHPIELLKLCGIDMSGKEPIEEALKVFEGLLNEFEEASVC